MEQIVQIRRMGAYRMTQVKKINQEVTFKPKHIGTIVKRNYRRLIQNYWMLKRDMHLSVEVLFGYIAMS